jgi:integrase
MVKCPECGSQRTWKDGKRYAKEGEIQRYLCRSCGYRFSQPKVKVNVAGKRFENSNPRNKNSHGMVLGSDFPIQKGSDDLSLPSCEDVGSHVTLHASTVEKALNSLCLYNRECRVSASEGEAKNLAEKVSQTEKRAAGATETSESNMKGLVVSLSFWMLKQGYRESTIRLTCQRLKHLVKLGADLFDQESIKEAIARQKWQESTKVTYVNSYALFAGKHDLQLIKPRYKTTHQKLPFIPTEKEIDQLIASCSKKVSTFLQLLKETGMRSGEAIRLKWKHLDFVTKNVRINNPEKRGNTRIIRISDKLIAMLKALRPKSDQVFRGSVHCLRSNFGIQRNRAAEKLKNPRLQRISFHTFRHWKATMEYHRTKDILHVKRLLGHKSINSTLLYTQLITFEGDEYHVKVAETKKERTELLEAGFEWVGQDKDGLTYLRKRK